MAVFSPAAIKVPRFEALERASLMKLFTEIDEDSRDLLAAYLDRREPGWRGHAQSEGSAGAKARPGGTGKMTEEEAHQILGIRPGASTEEISRGRDRVRMVAQECPPRLRWRSSVFAHVLGDG
jgi:hypothetical protein